MTCGQVQVVTGLFADGASNARALEGDSLLFIDHGPAEVTVGPLVDGAGEGCLICWQARRLAVDHEWRPIRGEGPSATVLASTLKAATTERHRLRESCLVLKGSHIDWRPMLRRMDCPQCGGPRVAVEPHRLIDDLVGIVTGMRDLEPDSDEPEGLHVALAVLADHRFLGGGGRIVCSGRGLDPSSARAGAFGEALELYGFRNWRGTDFQPIEPRQPFMRRVRSDHLFGHEVTDAAVATASGDSPATAINRATWEVVERDALARAWQRGLFGQPLEPGPAGSQLMAEWTAAGAEVLCLRLPAALAGHVALGVVFRPEATPAASVGVAAGDDASMAADRAVQEASQVHRILRSLLRDPSVAMRTHALSAGARPLDAVDHALMYSDPAMAGRLRRVLLTSIDRVDQQSRNRSCSPQPMAVDLTPTDVRLAGRHVAAVILPGATELTFAPGPVGGGAAAGLIHPLG